LSYTLRFNGHFSGGPGLAGIGVNPTGDAGDVSPPIFWLVGTSMGMSPLIFGVAM